MGKLDVTTFFVDFRAGAQISRVRVTCEIFDSEVN